MRTQFYDKDGITYEWGIESECVVIIDWWREPDGVKVHKEQCELEAIEAEIAAKPETWEPDYDYGD